MLIAAGPTMAKLVTTYVVTALLLSIALFDLIECQRKVSRPLPSSSETKGRERANFDCPEEFGYYPHPSDCTQYYVCVFGGALLESCTGGLMYSHELQTCDWPRNVGCDGLEISNHPAASASTGTHSQTSRGRERSRSQEKDDVRTDLSSKYSIPPPPPPQPKAVVTTRGQPRQLQNQQEIIKQQLYADVEEDLPPAEEVESDRQQRVYRGQPSLVGQVQRDRDGYRHTNALPTYKDRGEKIGVISFGTQSQLQHYSTVPDLNETITNHITLKKRRKRQANRRRIPSTDHSAHWHAGSRKRYLANNRLLPDYNTHSLNPITYKADDEHFQPFIPNYVLSTIRTPLRHYPVKTFQNVIPNVYKDYLPSPIKVEKKKTQFREANEKSPINKGVKEYNYYEAKKPLRNNNEVYADYSQNVAHTIKPSSKKHLYKDDLHDIEEITERYETNNKTQQKQNYNSVSHIEMDLNHKPTINQPKEYEDSTDSNKADKDSIDKGTESKVEDPKNVTVSYEYYSEEEDDDLGPPEAFYNHHNKYKEIYNPFENPHFDFDTFLAKLGSTTSTTTKTTTTTKRSVSPSKIKANSEEVVESLRLNKERTNNYSNNNSIKNTELSLLTATLRPALQNIKPVTEHLDNDDYYDDTKQTVKNVYSSKIKLNGHRLPTTTASSDEYEYYYEEYDYPEPKLNNQEMLKLNNKTDSYAPIYSSKYHESQRRQNSEETKNQIKYLIPNTYSNITKITITTLPPAQTTFKQINKLLRGQKGEVDSSQFLVETSTLVTTRKPEKKVNTSRKRTKTQPSPSKTEKHTKTTPLPTTTEIYALDPKQEQSIIYISQEKNGVSQTANTGLTAGTATARTLYNSSQYNNINQNDNRYDPFYALYDEDVELYKDVDYNQQNNNNYNTNSQQTGSRATTSVYRGSPGVVREESTKRGNIVYNNVNQDIYQQPSTSDYSDNSYQDEDTAYRQSTRTSSSLRGDRNDINDIEDLPITTKRTASITRKITTTTTTTPRTTTAQARIISPKKSTTSSARTPSRGRGTSHYTNSASINSNEVTVNVNRGTPAPRARPTLKPSTSIVSKASEFIDIYKFPPRRPDPLYPQPQPDKTAAKCRKDVCLLPDCSCGGKDIPGDIPVTETPQIVLMTFDDAVNDLNKPYYIDLFENGRRNPNGCPITATFYVSHEWTDYSQVQNLYADGHELASHTVSHSFGEQFSQKKWTKEVAGQREILSAYGGVKLEDVRGMRAPFLSVGGNKMFKMLYDSNFTYDSSMPIYENKPPSWPYTLDYKLFHDCMIPPCPTRSYPGVWEVPMVMWQDLNGGRCSMGDACSNPPDADGVFKMLIKNFQRHYTTNRAPFGLFYHAAWFTQPHHKEGFINFIDTILAMKDVWIITNWQALQWVRDPTPTNRLNNFQAFQCDYSDRPKRCNNPKVCNLWHKSGVRYMRTCQPCPDIYPWTGNTGIRSSRIDNDIEDSNN
ncbi:uncharacterized protein LOC126748381 isoform X7 [Anthonomus grandis grandis]|uniref:uncharacterized protein LOC126748381 isoform X7 n=1 Tax=Anthonomus grandis grandis TaxID=2921223 RepID=UPI00216646F3|nr:uncharacterized protein LOC126748381 isoform X7 [Anthonomus grandis grandis]